jgi:uncharacterized membrane protein YadS
MLLAPMILVGLQTDIRKLRANGWKPLLVGAGS